MKLFDTICCELVHTVFVKELSSGIYKYHKTFRPYVLL